MTPRIGRSGLKLFRAMTPQLIAVVAADCRHNLLAACVLHKEWKCAGCELQLHIGDEAWRPTLSTTDRHKRICPGCVTTAIQQLKGP